MILSEVTRRINQLSFLTENMANVRLINKKFIPFQYK